MSVERDLGWIRARVDAGTGGTYGLNGMWIPVEDVAVLLAVYDAAAESIERSEATPDNTAYIVPNIPFENLRIAAAAVAAVKEGEQ